jgi:hypothetical protein
MVGDWISWFSGVALLFFGFLVLWAYRPQSWAVREAPGALQAAIFLGFLASVGNTVFWQVIGQPIVNFGLMNVDQYRALGDWLDFVFKGGAAYAAWLHLKALHMSLPPKERSAWGVLEMAFYPKRRLCLRLLARIIRRSEK